MRILPAFCLASAFFATTLCSAQDTWKRLIDAPTFGIAVNPHNPNSLVVGGRGRRIYFSTDAGKTWRRDSIEFTTASTQFTNVFIHPQDTNIIIVGGINFGSMRRSTDNGKTWEIVFDPEPGAIVLNGESMTAAPHNPEHVYFARLNPPILYRSSDRGATWDSISTIPRVNPDDSTELDPFFCTIAFRQDSSNIMFAGTGGGRIYKSIDTGNTWKPLERISKSTYGDAEVPRIVFSRANPLIGYAVVTYFFPLSLPNGAVHRTTDGGNTWHELSLKDTSLWSVDVPIFGSPDEVAVGGFSVPVAAGFRVPGDGVVGVTKDAGANWKRYDDEIPWLEKEEHNVWLLEYAGATPETQKLYMATEAGFFVKDAVAVGVETAFKNTDYTVHISNKHIRVKFSSPMAVDDNIHITNILGQTVVKAAISRGGEVLELPLPEELPHGSYILHSVQGQISSQVFVIE